MSILNYFTSHTVYTIVIAHHRCGCILLLSILGQGSSKLKWWRFPHFRCTSKITWKTVCILWENVSKLDLETRPLDVHPRWIWRDGNLPPKSCDPSRAKIPRNRKSRTSRDTIASILFVRDSKRFCNFLQYLLMICCGTKRIMEMLYKQITAVLS